MKESELKEKALKNLQRNYGMVFNQKKTTIKVVDNFFDQFVLFKGNRDILNTSVVKLLESIEMNGYLEEESIYVTPLDNVVHPGKYVILDGQHRFTACKILNTKFTYTIVNDVKTASEIEERIKIYNVDRVNLNSDDYLKMNIDRDEYKRLNDLVLLTGFSVNLILKMNGKDTTDNRIDFKYGRFTMTEGQYNLIVSIHELNNIIKANNPSYFNSFALPLYKVLSDKNINILRLQEKLYKYAIKMKRGTIIHNIVELYNVYNFAARDLVNVPISITKKMK